MRQICKLALLTLVISAFAIFEAQAFSYKYSFFDGPGATADTYGHGINDSGQVVGMYQANVSYHGFILENGKFTILDVPGATDTAAFGINASGRVCGTYGVMLQGIYHGFTYEKEAYTYPLDIAEATGTEVHGINNNGDMAGIYLFNGTHGFLKSGETITKFDYPDPNALSTKPYGINNNGWIAGFYTDADGVHHGFVRLPSGSFMSLDIPGATNTEIYGINDDPRLQVAGTYWHSDGYRHGFVMTGGVVTTLAIQDHTDTRVLGLNNLGQVVGQYKANQVFHGFIATPVKATPGSLQLLLGD